MGITIIARIYLNSKFLLAIYHTFAYTYLTYCIKLLSFMSDINLDALVKMKQKKCLYDALFKEVSILSIHKLILRRIFLQMINILEILYQEIFANSLSLMIHSFPIVQKNENKLRSKTTNRGNNVYKFIFCRRVYLE